MLKLKVGVKADEVLTEGRGALLHIVITVARMFLPATSDHAELAEGHTETDGRIRSINLVEVAPLREFEAEVVTRNVLQVSGFENAGDVVVKGEDRR